MLTHVEVPRMEWQLAIVIEAHKDSVKVRLGALSLDRNGGPSKQATLLERPIQSVVVLAEAK